jgi:hypothetical protein
MTTALLLGYAFMAASTFIAVYDSHDRDFSTITKVIGSAIIAALWPLAITAKLLQKLFD